MTRSTKDSYLPNLHSQEYSVYHKSLRDARFCLTGYKEQRRHHQIHCKTWIFIQRTMESQVIIIDFLSQQVCFYLYFHLYQTHGINNQTFDGVFHHTCCYGIVFNICSHLGIQVIHKFNCNTGNHLTINTIDVIIDTLRNQLRQFPWQFRTSGIGIPLYKYLGVYPCFPNESHL